MEVRDKNNEKGFALVTVIVAMFIMVFLGIAAMLTSTTEKEIAGIDKIHTDTFYQADGGVNLAAEMIEQNINCTTGFSKTSGNDAIIEGLIRVLGDGNLPAHFTNSSDANGSLDFWQNPPPDRTDATHYPTETNRDFYYPASYNPGEPHTNFVVGGNTIFAQGAALLMVSGYEGKGKGEAAGGSQVLYQIIGDHMGLVNSRATVCMQWRHVIGSEEECKYN